MLAALQNGVVTVRSVRFDKAAKSKTKANRHRARTHVCTLNNSPSLQIKFGPNSTNSNANSNTNNQRQCYDAPAMDCRRRKNSSRRRVKDSSEKAWLGAWNVTVRRPFTVDASVMGVRKYAMLTLGRASTSFQSPYCCLNGSTPQLDTLLVPEWVLGM